MVSIADNNRTLEAKMTIDHTSNFEKIKEKSIADEILTEDSYNFYHDLFTYQKEYINIYNEKSTDLKTPGFLSDKELPILSISDIAIDESLKDTEKQALEALTLLLKKFQDGINLDSVKTKYSENPSLLINSIESLMNNDFEEIEALSKELKIGTDEFIFIVINWIKPFMINLRSDYFDKNTPDLTEWFDSTCPFCGYYPDISKIVESKENLKSLHCSLCEHEWPFKRITCAICGNEDAQKLGFYTYEDDKKYRVDYCEECKGYIKSIRIPKEKEESGIDLAVENIISNFLDATAIDMGYKCS